MGTSLDRLLASHGAGDDSPSAPTPTALDALLAQRNSAHQSVPVGEQAVGAAKQVYNFFSHPYDAAKGLVLGAVHSAEDVFKPTIGESNYFPGSDRFGDEGEAYRSVHPTIVTKENTPGAITSGQQALGALNTAANLVLPGTGGVITSRLVNAGLGAANDKEQPVRGALTGLAIGEVLHAPSHLANIADVSDGMTAAGAQGVDETVAEQAPLWQPGRRPQYSLDVRDRQPVEPAPSVEPASAGGEPMTALDKLLSTRTYLNNRGRSPDDIGDVGRRPMNSLPVAQRIPVEPDADVTPQTFGDTPLKGAVTPEAVALRARLAQEAGLPVTALGDITRRPMNVSPPVEPGPDAATQSFARNVRRPSDAVVPSLPTIEDPALAESSSEAAPTPPTAAIDAPTALEKLLAEHGPDVQKPSVGNVSELAASTSIAPREVPSSGLPREQTALDALLSKYAPNAVESLNMNGHQEDDGRLGAVSFGGKLDGMPEPIASSNGTFEARPGVIRAVNKALDENGRIASIRPGDRVFPVGTKTVRDVIGTPESPTFKSVAPEDVVRPPLNSTEGPPPVRALPVPKVDLFDDSRNASGRLRPLHRVSDDALVRELRDLDTKTADAHARSQYNFTTDENFHSTEDGRGVFSATRVGGHGVSEQAKALQNLADYQRIRQSIYDELGKRGHDEAAVTSKLLNQFRLDEAIEREGMAHADSDDAANYAFGADDDFHFGSNERSADNPSGTHAPIETDGVPRNVPASQLLNRSKLDLDPTGERELDAELARLKAQGLDKQRVSFETQRKAAQDFADNLNIDRLTLDHTKYSRLSGAEIVGLKNVVSRNLNEVGDLSKRLNDPDLTMSAASNMNDRLDALRTQNDALLSKIVTESSQKGRDLGFLRQMSNATLDPDAWVVQAKKMAGDRMLSDEEIANVQRLAKAAQEACQ